MMRLRDRLWFVIVCLAIFGVDQLSKQIVSARMMLYQSIPIIPGFLNLTYIHNRGVVFGLFADAHHPMTQNIILALSILSFAVIAIYFLFIRHENHWMTLGFSFVLGGALGNTWDRLVQGYVVDFLDFYYGEYHWPTFNLADTFITIGILLLLMNMFHITHWYTRESADAPDAPSTTDGIEHRSGEELPE